MHTCCTNSVIGDRVTSPTWVWSQFMTLISRMDHLGGIAHAFHTFLMLPHPTWVSWLLHVQYDRAIFSYKIITDLILTKTIVAMVTRSFRRLPNISRRLPNPAQSSFMRRNFNMHKLNSQSQCSIWAGQCIT